MGLPNVGFRGRDQGFSGRDSSISPDARLDRRSSGEALALGYRAAVYGGSAPGSTEIGVGAMGARGNRQRRGVQEATGVLLAFPQPGKAKAQAVCEAFAEGCGGRIAHISERTNGPVMFYGVRPRWAHIWHHAKATGQDWFYGDNSAFDCARERQFRISRNSIQPVINGTSDGARVKALGVQIKPWKTGRHILVCAQSDEFMSTVAMNPGWLSDTLEDLRAVTDRPIIVRRKGDLRPLAELLKDCYAVVTWSSAAAFQALVAGVPIHCSPQCSAYPFSTNLDEIETPKTPDGREDWAAILADQQWCLEEIKRGDAWRALTTPDR